VVRLIIGNLPCRSNTTPGSVRFVATAVAQSDRCGILCRDQNIERGLASTDEVTAAGGCGSSPVAAVEAEVVAEFVVTKTEASGGRRGAEATHRVIPAFDASMVLLDSIVQIAARSMTNAITSEFVGHDDSRFVLKSDEQPSEETLRRLAIATALNQNIEHDTVLVHGAPKIMKDTVDPDEHLVQIPLVSRLRPAASDPFREARAEFQAPAAHGFVRQGDASLGEHQFDVAETQTERVIQPHGVADDLGGEPVAMVRAGRGLHSWNLT
jgi:hypothetical protein